jgi:hypothetical protein
MTVAEFFEYLSTRDATRELVASLIEAYDLRRCTRGARASSLGGAS